MSKITYRGCSIETDRDECGTSLVYVYMTDGGDPLEIIGGSIERAKSVIDECLRDLDEFYGPVTTDEREYRDSLSASYDY